MPRCDCHVAAVVVVGGAGALGRDHGRAQRRSGRAFLAERGAVVRLLQALQHLAADAHGRLLRRRCPERRSAVSASKLAVLGCGAGSRSSGMTPMPRHLRSQTSNTSRDQLARLDGLPSRRHGARVLVLHARRGPASSWRTAISDAFQQVERLEAGDDDRHAVALDDRLVFAVAHDRADVARAEEPLHAVARRSQDAPSSPAAPARATPAREVPQAPLAGPARRPSRWPARSSRSRWRRRRPRVRGWPAASLTASSGE